MDIRTLKKLDKITSSFSFGRVLSLISIRENTSLASILGQEFRDGDERLINMEIGFLAALWINNFKKTSQNWESQDDHRKFNETYRLMRIYHNSLKSRKYGEKHREVSVYEGDGGYDWQFLDLAKYKYQPIKDYLRLKENFDIDYIHSAYDKLMGLFNMRLKGHSANRLIYDTNLSLDITCMPIDLIKSTLSPEEYSIFNHFTIELGTSIFPKGNKNISNLFGSEFKPIILLPNNKIFIPSFYLLAKYINESPFYWITDNDKMMSEIGTSAEIGTYNIVKDCFSSEIVHHSVLIKKGKIKYTDIDILLTHNEHAIIFQQKGKKLTMESMQGNESKIRDDFEKAVAKAYDQGIRCVDAIQNRQKFTFPEDIDFSSCTKYHIICLTTDYYPTITSMSYEKREIVENGRIPLVAMTLYDLYAILVLLDIDSYIEYVIFREQCVSLYIYGDNEMFYLGKYLAYKLNPNEPNLYKGEKLPKEYAVLVDYIMYHCRHREPEKPYINLFLSDLSMDDNIKKSLFDIFLSITCQTRKIIPAKSSNSEVDISMYLQFLSNTGWSEIIDVRWKHEVKKSLMTNFPQMTDEEWMEIENVIFL